ncbi:MAG: hypothetical protein ABI880_13415 [Acidobacteriota bacterium]
MTSPRLGALAITAFAASLLLAGSSAAQTPAAGADARWTPWLGCWRSVDDGSAGRTRVCVTRAESGVILRTIVAGQAVSEEARVADGAPRPLRDAGCTGTESTRWSADGLRAYRAATASCGSDPARTLASVAFFTLGSVWVDVQTVTTAGSTNVRVSRYTRAPNQQLPDGTMAAQAPLGVASPTVSRGWTTDEVVEASTLLPADGVQAAIAEGPTAFRLNARSLTTLADAGVTGNVIDLMVALTYPEKFVVDRAGRSSSGIDLGMMMASTGGLDPFYADIVGPAAMYSCYANYGWAMSDYWRNCAGYNSNVYFGRPGYYNGYYGGVYDVNSGYGAWVNTQGPPPIEGVTPQPEGRLVNGRGYTQVRPADTLSSGGFGAVNNGSSTNSSSGSPSSGTSNSGGATSSGYSGGSSGSGGGGERTAVPRPPPGQ